MKRFLCLLTVLSLLFSACGRETAPYNPYFTVGEGYTLNGETISGTVIGEEYISLFSVFDTDEKFIIFGDSSAETFLESGVIPLKKGKNRLVVRFYEGEREREYDLHVEYIPIRSFSVELLEPDRTYHIGEKFDMSSIRVTAETVDGEHIVATRYGLEYEFSEIGEADVGITLGDYYKSITVSVTGEYLPQLDGSMSADGAKYAIKNGEAVLISAKETEGFFAVPRAVLVKGKEYPVTSVGNGAFSRSAVTSVLISEGVTRLERGVFSGCELLSSVTLPESLTEMGDQVFSDCISLDRIVIPSGITALPYGAFLGCVSLFRAELPEGLRVIDERAFSDCETLRRMDFPEGLQEIGKEAFLGCNALEGVILPSLRVLGERAFAECEGLTALAISQIETMGADVLADTKAVVYTTEGSALAAYAGEAGLTCRMVEADAPLVISLPKEFAIEDGFPYGEVFALMLKNGEIRELSDYEVRYPEDACGTLTATLTYGDFTHSFDIYISYTETALINTDTRGAVYEIDPLTKTAVIIDLPVYVRPSKIFVPAQEGLFLIPTHLSLPDGVYLVAGYVYGFEDGCENISEFVLPIS